MNITEPAFQKTLCGQSSRFKLWETLISSVSAGTLLEIGVWKGDFAEQILKRCDCIEKYYMIDPWANLPDWNKPLNVAATEFREVYNEAMQKTDFASTKRVVLKGRTTEVIDKIPDNSLDFAYIDGDHTLRGITTDLIRVFPKINEGGFVGGDDFVNTPWQHSTEYEPTLVCPFSIYFAEAMNVPILALPHSQFLIQKTSDTAFSFTDTTGEYCDISLNKLPPKTPFMAQLRRAIKQLARKAD